jgi:hypothetical protein
LGQSVNYKYYCNMFFLNVSCYLMNFYENRRIGSQSTILIQSYSVDLGSGPAVDRYLNATIEFYYCHKRFWLFFLIYYNCPSTAYFSRVHLLPLIDPDSSNAKIYSISFLLYLIYFSKGIYYFL